MTDSSKPSTAGAIARDGIWLTLDNVVATVVAVASSILVARILGPEKMGYYNYVVWAAQMVKLVADVGVPLAVRRYVSEYRGRGDYETVATIARVAEHFQRAMAFVATAASLAYVFVIVDPAHRGYAALVMAGVAPALLIGVPASVLWATGNLAASVKASIAGAVSNLVLVVLALALALDLEGLALAMLGSRSLDLLLRYRAYRRVVRGLPEAPPALLPDLKKRVVSFCWHQTVLLAIEVVIWNRSELFFLERFAEIHEVAFYSLTFNLVQYILLVPQIMSSSVGASMMVKQGQAPEDVGRMASTSLWFIFVVAVPASFGVAAVADPAVRLLYGSQYLPAIPVLALLGLFGLARSLSYPVLEVLYVIEKQAFVVRFSFVMVFVNAALGFWWIPGNGAVAAACVKGAVHFLSLLGLWIYAARTAGLSLSLSRALRLVFSALAMAVAVAALGRFVPPVLGLLLGIPLGVAVLALMLRLTRTLDAADAGRLASLGRLFPAALRPRYVAMLRVMVPSFTGAG